VFSGASQTSFHEFVALLNGMRMGNLMDFSDGVIRYQDPDHGSSSFPSLGIDWLVNVILGQSYSQQNTARTGHGLGDVHD
jgi:hypothetical protein